MHHALFASLIQDTGEPAVSALLNERILEGGPGVCLPIASFGKRSFSTGCCKKSMPVAEGLQQRTEAHLLHRFVERWSEAVYIPWDMNVSCY